MHFISLFETAENRDCIFDGWLTNVNLLKAGVRVPASFSMYFLYSFSVVAPTQRSSPRASAGFNMFDASMAPSAAPATDQRMKLVDEENYLTLGALDLFQNCLQSIFKFTSILGTGEHRTKIKCNQSLVT
jgi:hypothetical protein